MYVFCFFVFYLHTSHWPNQELCLASPSCLACVFAVRGLFISPDDEGSIISEVLVNYQTLWHHIPENHKFHSH
jgi:hypothetical protein